MIYCFSLSFGLVNNLLRILYPTDYFSASSLLEPYPGGQEVSVLASDYQLPVLPKNG